MERVIKFRRPWFKYADKQFDHFTYWGVNLMITNNTKVEFVAPGNWSHGFFKEDQQFIGLLDRNGKEIYEGDIIGGKSHNWVVTFYNGSFGFWSKENSIPEFFMLYRYLGIKEIIGNIYENPDLINPAKV